MESVHHAVSLMPIAISVIPEIIVLLAKTKLSMWMQGYEHFAKNSMNIVPNAKVSHVTMMPCARLVCLITSCMKVGVNYVRIFLAVWIMMIKNLINAKMDTSCRLDYAESVGRNSIHALNVILMDAICAKKDFMLMEIVDVLIAEVFLRVMWNVTPKNAVSVRRNTFKRMINVSYVIKLSITAIPA